MSFDPRETPELAREKKDSYVRRLGRPGSKEGWHFFTGKEEEVRRLSEEVGFRYVYDPERGEFASRSRHCGADT